MADELVLRGQGVTADEHGNICLNDLWRLAGQPANKQAKDWFGSKRVAAVKVILDQRMVENFPHSAPPPTYQVVGKGRASRTYAHVVLAMDYAEYLDPALAIEVRETFLRVKGKDVSLALEILEGMSEQAEYDSQRVQLRTLLKEHNKQSVQAASEAGVTNFEAYNGAGVKGLYGGLTAAQVVKRKGLPQEAKHLDHAGHEELAANYFKATQTIAKIKREGISGQTAANTAHREVAEGVRETIKGFGGTMPEDEPALDNIREAEKRLKAADTTPSLPKPAKVAKK